MQKHLTVLFAFTIFVLLVGWAVTPAQAHCSLNPTHNEKHKTDPCIEGEGDMVIYHVTVSGDLFQIPVDPYEGTDGGGRSKPVAVFFQFLDLDLSFFFDKFGETSSGVKPPGKNCFDGAPVDGHNRSSLKISQEKDGMAIVQYYFDGFGDDGMTEVGYLLEMFDGTFIVDWRPAAEGDSTTVNFTEKSWEMSINGTGGVRNIACIGTGDFTDDPGQTILVERTN